MKPKNVFAVAAVAVLVFSGISHACTISASGLSFGGIGLLTSAVDSTATITVNCPALTTYAIGLSGLNGSGSSNKLTNGANAIDYGLFKDPSRNDPWGDLTDPSGTQTGTGIGSDQQYTVYGRVYRQPSPAPGSYTDAVTITVEY